MEELIKVTQNENGELLVSGRELHEFLGVGRDFTTWIKGRIAKYDFIEDADFTVISLIHQNGGIKTGRGGDVKSVDYAIKLDMAKELAMVENNDKGKQARRYFIQCEKKLKEIVKQDSYLISDPIERAKRWIEEQEEKRALEQKVKDNEHMVLLAEKRLDNGKCISITDATKSEGLKRGQITKWAKDKGYLHKTITEVNKAGEDYFKIYCKDGVHSQIGITDKGLKHIHINLDEIKTY